MNVYFYKYNFKRISFYKKNFSEQIYNGIKKYSNKIKIVNDILKANYIFTTGDYLNEIINKYDLKKMNIKIIVISLQDNLLFNTSILKNDDVIYIFDHLKLINVPNLMYPVNETFFSYSTY